MPLSEILSQSSSSKICLLLCSLFYWCSCPVEMVVHPMDNSDRDESFRINYKDEPNDINAIFNAESREWHPWQQVNPNLPLIWSLFTLPTKYTKPLDYYYPRQLNKVLNSLRRHIKKESFSTELNDFGKSIDEKRFSSDMRGGSESATSFEVGIPYENTAEKPTGKLLWPGLTTTKHIVQIPTGKLVSTRMSGGKKSDTDIVYRDGFLGVRG